MASIAGSGYLLDAQQARFIGGPVSINIASADANLVPSVARAFGCRLSRDRLTLTVFLPEARAAALLRDLRAGGAIAAVFSRPSSHRTLQLKGRDVVIAALAPGDRERMLAYGEQLAAEIRGLGYPEPFARALVMPVGDAAVAASFAPLAAFEQTPGPAAGQALPIRP
jgi:hypothetical protein